MALKITKRDNDQPKVAYYNNVDLNDLLARAWNVDYDKVALVAVDTPERKYSETRYTRLTYELPPGLPDERSKAWHDFNRIAKDENLHIVIKQQM